MVAATTSLTCQIVRVKVLAMKSFQLLPERFSFFADYMLFPLP